MSSPTDRIPVALKARHPLIHLQTEEEVHALQLVTATAADLSRPVWTWSVVHGLCEGSFAGERIPEKDTEHLAGALRWWTKGVQTRVLVLFDPLSHLSEEVTQRALREALQHVRSWGGSIVVIDAKDLPPSLAGEAVVCEIPLPDDSEIANLAKDTLREIKDKDRFRIDLTHGQFGDLVAELRGMTRTRLAQVIREAAAERDAFDVEALKRVTPIKRRLLRTGGLLESVETGIAMGDVAGLDGLKAWLTLRMQAEELKDHGLPPPRGVLVLGVPGTGKSLCAKAIAQQWKRPLLRLDAGVLYGPYIGESESRLRRALLQAEALAPVVLWIDEIEKAFASAAAQSIDGGLSQRLFATYLTWMNEHKAQVFIVATANTISALPPELLRKGRFDEIFFVDLPEAAARRACFAIHLKKRNRDPDQFPLDELVERSDGRTGTEIEQVVVSALWRAVSEKRDLEVDDLFHALEESPPLSLTMREHLDQMRAWARERCRKA